MTPKPAGQPIEVLLVEDDPGDVLLIREAFDFNKVHNNLNVVNDGEQALAYLRREGEYSGSLRPDRSASVRTCPAPWRITRSCGGRSSRRTWP